MMGPDPRWQRRPNPFADPGSPMAGGPLGGAQAPVFPQQAPAFNPPAPPQTLPSVGMPGGNPTGPPPAPGGGMPGVGQMAGMGQQLLSMKDQAPGNAMVSGAMTGMSVGGPVGAAAGAGAGLLMSILGGGKKNAPRPALLLPPRR